MDAAQTQAYDCQTSEDFLGKVGLRAPDSGAHGAVQHFLVANALCTVFDASAAASPANLPEVTQRQELDPGSLWGTAPLANAPPPGLSLSLSALLARSPW